MATPIISVDDLFVSENDGTADFVVRLSEAASGTVTVGFNTSAGTAGANVDYTQTGNQTLTFAAGETVKVVHVGILEDATVEPDKSFFLNLFSPTNAVLGNNYGVGTIIDNDAATGTPVISIGDRVVDEMAGVVTFAVALSRPSAGTVTVHFATAVGTAGASDFTAVNGTLTFHPGDMVKTVSVPISNDGAAEGEERFDLVLSNPVGATLPDARGTALIGASDQATVGTPVISVADLTVGENDGVATFVVRLSAPSTNAVTVSFNTSAGTAGANVDYVQTGNHPLTFAAGETVKTVEVPIIDDSSAEPKEGFFLNLFSPTNAVLGNNYALATIIDDDGLTGTPVISIGDRVIDETAGVVTFAITLDRPSAGTVTVDFATATGTAGASDFTAMNGTLAFAPGDTVKTVTVPISNDSAAESEERFDLVLTNPVGATLPDARGTALIGASDQATVGTPVISVADVTVGENNGFAEFVVRLSAPSTNAVTVSFNTSAGTAGANADYLQIGNHPLTFTAGETVKTVEIPIINDATAESKEVFFLNLFSPTNAVLGNNYSSATIIDNDAVSGTPVISIGDRLVDETAGTVTFAITLDRPSNGTVTVDFATATGTAGASDFTAVNGTLAFAPGDTARTVTVPISNDGAAEGEERFDLVLSNPVGATLPDARGTAVIGASDQATVGTPVVSVADATVGENNGFAEFVVRLSAPSTNAVTVNFNTSAGTAGANADYLQIGNHPLTFAAGETVKTLEIPILNDATAESKEVFFLNLFSPTNAVIGTPYAMATIIDNDAVSGTPVISIDDRFVDETAGTVTFAIALDRPSSGTVMVDFATATGTAGASDFTAVNGTLAFAPGETVKTVTVPISNDGAAEGEERFDLVLTNPVGATLPDPRGTAVIGASDQAIVATPVIATSGVIAGEGDGFAEFVLRLSAPSANAVTVSFNTSANTAGANADYIQLGNHSITFAAGETIETVRVPIIDDTTTEPDESFFLNLFSAVNATIAASSTQVTATIWDNDPTVIMHEGLSNDTYTVTHTSDRIIEVPGGGTDTVLASATYTLGANLENLTLTGGAAIDGTGNSLDNVIAGNGAANVLNGAGGNDTVSYASATAGVTVSLALAGAQNTGGAGTDTLSGFENLTGSSFADHLTGSAGANVLNGGPGNDGLDGGAGIDTASYASATAGVTVSLAIAGAQNTGGAGTDTLTGIENLLGSDFNDVLTGSAGANTLNGGLGNDVLNGGAGNDNLNGAAGTDTASYATATAGVTVSLAVAGAQNTVGAGTDTLASIENLTGSGFADHLIGNSGANRIEGLAGLDTMSGGAAADTFAFSSLNASGNSNPTADVITDFVPGTDRIDVAAIDANTSAAGNQAFAFVGTDTFTAAAQAQFFQQGANTFVALNTDADNSPEMMISLTGLHTLTAADFLL